MSINFSQFPAPRLPITAADFVVGYQIVGTGTVPTLAQYTMLQLAGVLGPLIGTLPPSGTAGGDLSGTYPNPTVAAVHATSGTLDGVVVGGTTAAAASFTSLTASGTVSGAGFTALLAPYAPLASPTFTGTPVAPTAATATNTTQIATTAYVVAKLAAPTPIGSTTPNTGAFTTISASGTITPSQTAGVVGTTTNNNANAGSVGEYVTASATAVSLTTAVAANVTSISLTAGDWDVSGVVQVTPAGTTVVTSENISISTTSATVGPLGSAAFNGSSKTAGAADIIPTPVVRISIAATTTVFLVAGVSFTTSTLTVSGLIRARRVR